MPRVGWWYKSLNRAIDVNKTMNLNVLATGSWAGYHPVELTIIN